METNDWTTRTHMETLQPANTAENNTFSITISDVTHDTSATISPSSSGHATEMSSGVNTSTNQIHTEPEVGTPCDINSTMIDDNSELLSPSHISTETNNHHSEPEIKSAPLTTPSASPDNSFPLLKLPSELRLNVYHYLFTDLTINRQRAVADLTQYHEPSEWPDNDLSAYINLLQTNKSINNEAKDLWEKQYASKCCLYFWQVPKLYDAAQALRKLGEPYTSTRYVLRSRVEAEHDFENFAFLEEEPLEFMRYQPGFPPGYNAHRRFFWGVEPLHSHLRAENGHTGEINGIRFRFFADFTRASDLCQRIEYPLLRSCEISVHLQIKWPHNNGSTHYALMFGQFAGISWGAYDAATSYGKMRMYEEMVRCCFEEPHLRNGESVINIEDSLLWWHIKRVEDSKWLSLGGQIEEDEQDALDMAYNYGMDEWLSFRGVTLLTEKR